MVRCNDLTLQRCNLVALVLRHALSQAERSQRFAGQISARLQTLVALITDDGMMRFRSEDAVDLSTVITCSGQSLLSVGNLYGCGPNCDSNRPSVARRRDYARG